jgi:hypothetical protein
MVVLSISWTWPWKEKIPSMFERPPPLELGPTPAEMSRFRRPATPGRPPSAPVEAMSRPLRRH